MTGTVDKGTFLVKSKRSQVSRGSQKIARILGFPSRQVLDSARLDWFAFFGFASELIEAGEHMDARSLRRLLRETREALAFKGPHYWVRLENFLIRLPSEIRREARRYRLIGAACRSMVSGLKSLDSFSNFNLDPSDVQLDEFELYFIATTEVARFIGYHFVFEDDWEPKVSLFRHCLPTNCDSGSGCIAADIGVHRDRIGLLSTGRVQGVALDRTTWLYRPSRYSRTSVIKHEPPKAEIFVRFSDPELDRALSTIVARSRVDLRRATLLFNALDKCNLGLLVGEDPFPQTQNPLEESDFWSSWDFITSEILPGDRLFSRDTRDGISSVIANIDEGSWSHVSTYIGDGLLHEIEPPRSNIVQLRLYANPTYRLALFRDQYSVWMSPARLQAESRQLTVRAKTNQGNLYDLFGALCAGIENVFSNEPNRPTPNSLIRSGGFVPIEIA
jgi:hypothetical protein